MKRPKKKKKINPANYAKPNENCVHEQHMSVFGGIDLCHGHFWCVLCDGCVSFLSRTTSEFGDTRLEMVGSSTCGDYAAECRYMHGCFIGRYFW
jgi:hypothetical protein